MGNWKSIFKLVPFLKPYSIIFILGSIGLFIGSIISLPVPYLTGQLLDKVLLYSKSYNQFFFYILLIGFLYIADYIITVLSKNLFVRINNSIVNDMRVTIMSKVMELPMSYLSKVEKGYIQGRIAECSSIGGLFSPTVIGIIFTIIQAVMSIFTMFILDWKMALIVLGLTPFFLLASKASTGNFMKSTRNMMESSAVLNGECFEILNGVEDIKILNGKSWHLQKFKSKVRKLILNGVKQGKSMIIFMENINLINNLGSLIILLVSGILILKGQFTVGFYTSFSLYSVKVFTSAQGVVSLNTTIKPICLNIERLYELLNMDDENSKRNKYLNGSIVFVQLNNVEFRYEKDLPLVLNHISFNLNRGEKVLIRGANGSGKTTLIKLLLGLYSPTDGAILFNNINTIELNRDSLRKRISVVSQNIFLFRGTVLENILYGQISKSREDVEQLI